jgi:hypothetical protein
MDVRGTGVSRSYSRFATSLFSSAAVIVVILFSCSSANALPAFARKYGLPCSACHEAWPMLSPFGQQFKDNGYQLGNDRDAPIWQNPGYWPVTFRITPVWHRESQDPVAVDQGPGQATVTTHGFDVSGLDFHTGGTLANNFSFYVLPSSDSFASFHFESVWARMDNLLGSSWLNIKMGKFELDNLLSEKRILTLTNVSGVYTNYHFQPFSRPGVPENYTFGIGDNQFGVEWLGHSKDDRWRASAALLSENEGTPGLPTNRGYGGYFTGSYAFQVGSLGLQRIAAFTYIGEAPTYFQYTQGGFGVPGTEIGNKPLQRYGLYGAWYIKNFDITTMYFHSHDSAWLGTNTSATPGAVLPEGARAPTWNGALFESHYMFNPQFLLLNRFEMVRVSQQAFGGPADPTTGYVPNPGNLGNANVLTFGFRYYPFISSRAGFAYHGEYAINWQKGAFVSPVNASIQNQATSSLLFGFDFDF